MSAKAARTQVPDGDEGSGSLPSVLRTKRTIALLRICVLAVVTVLSLNSVGIRTAAGPAALILLFDAFVYALACLVLSTRGGEASPWRRAVTLAIDVALITAWIEVTGGGRSEFWTLYLIVIAAVALRFGIVETVGVAVGLAVLLLAQLVEHGVLWTSRLYRPTLLLVAGFAIGVLSLQRADQRQKRFEMEAIAESRARQLGRERAEVARLRKVDLARTEFVGVAAHELRTPLAAILGVLSTLKEHGAVLEDRVRVDLIDGAEGQAERLTRLVEDLLTVSRIQDGVLRLSMEPVDLGDLIADAARASGTAERLRLGPDAPAQVVCDADAIVRVLTNLFDNARKYSPEGTPIEVRVTRDDRRVTVDVGNAGSGIAPEDREAIFERFRRADGSGAPGAGLGLYISRGLVRAHGGELEVGDVPHGGTRFTFWLPVLDPGEREVSVGPSDDDAIVPAVSHITVPSLGQR
ncbi:MAG TPA: ATP-binding protein [Actinomycetota bacterium]|nr:ATP-binding protein [Actinomycetota bacterium]